MRFLPVGTRREAAPGGDAALAPEIPKGSATTDIGFDPKCLHEESGQRYSWWTFAPDKAYIQKLGGIKNCFHPQARPQGSGQEIGAYELSEGGGTGGGGAGGSTGAGGAGGAKATDGGAGAKAGAAGNGATGGGPPSPDDGASPATTEDETDAPDSAGGCACTASPTSPWRNALAVALPLLLAIRHFRNWVPRWLRTRKPTARITSSR